MVEYFDSPTSESVVYNIDRKFIERISIAKQTRVYCFDSKNAKWEIGHLLDDSGDSQLIQFAENRTRRLSCDSVFVRCSLPIGDPTSFLANLITESPRFSTGRSAFVRSQTYQRAASKGMSALLACAVELEPHQVEIVRRILQDPVQRYLLADEVGLGKTIEAGVLIRQCVLDMGPGCTVLVTVPAPLVNQWRTELSDKFFLGHHLNRSVHVISHDDDEHIRAILPKATMLVIDEAHHLIDLGIANATGVYQDIAAVAQEIERVLLLSATPALHNERGFLRMLHLLDPLTYPLDGEDSFRRKVESRQEVAEIIAGLTSENVLFLDHVLDQLRQLFPRDEILQEHVAKLADIVDTMPDGSDPVLNRAIDELHAHLSEVYRLHRRILRHRRRTLGALVPGRSGAEVVHYRSSDRAALSDAMANWQFREATKIDEAGEALWADRAKTFWRVLDRGSQYPSSGAGIVSLLAQRPGKISDTARFDAVRQCLGRSGLFEDRADALIKALEPLVSTDTKCIVFCSDTKSADRLAKRIADRLGIKVDRHDPGSDRWTAFNDDINRLVLVCDRRAEEGLNLQGGKKTVVHYDVPFNPNRIEQRLGRADRYGSEHAVRSVVLACEDDPFEMAWIDYLDSALRVFDRSVASLQYLLENTMRNLALPLLIEGPEGITELTAKSKGEHGEIEREISAIDQQDGLDALGTPPETLFDDLSAVEENWLTIAGDTNTWVEHTLQFERLEEPRLAPSIGEATPFRYTYSTVPRRHTLIPLQTFLAHSDAVSGPARSHPRENTTIRTMPYTYRRRTALHPRARANGVGLLRYGDDLIGGISAFTESDDRGRCFAMWRFAPDYSGDPVADIYFRFDFVIETDINAAACVLVDHDRDTRAARAAVRRRGDMALAPFYRSIWLDRELTRVRDASLLSRLERPYSVEPDRSGSFDLDLDARRWRRLFALQVPELSYWSELCHKARTKAEDTLRTEPDLIVSLAHAEERAARIDRGHIGQLRARACADATVLKDDELVFEGLLAAALRSGIRVPQVRLDTIGVVFVSDSSAATDRISGGT
ncbi:MAG: DEAD/DEAH box helicase [Rhizobiaceae bacterium]|nr:DEAD/DEAH box helicase [Rhizobiaceae bacterium]